jgi:hypothetical protein
MSRRDRRCVGRCRRRRHGRHGQFGIDTQLGADDQYFFEITQRVDGENPIESQRRIARRCVRVQRQHTVHDLSAAERLGATRSVEQNVAETPKARWDEGVEGHTDSQTVVGDTRIEPAALGGVVEQQYLDLEEQIEG